MKDTVILFRPAYEHEKELAIARQYFEVQTQRSQCPNKRVIGRYSVLPYYGELEKDLKNQGSTLINSKLDHLYISTFDYYYDVKDYTFETWFQLHEIPDDGQFVVKGRTNSRKARWNTQMFAPNREAAILIATELMQDPLLQEQGIIVRRYEPLELLEEGLNGQPFVNEHRIFFYRSRMIAHGFYWTQSEKKGELDQRGKDLANTVASIVSKYTNFFVLDVAKTAKGEWKLVEINDGQMSGLSCIDPDEFYNNLAVELLVKDQK
jgi:hypothetical protein